MFLKRIPLIAALVLPAPSLAQEPTTERQYLDLIAQEQDAGGPGSRRLIEPMTALGLLYFERGDYERAAETLARARGVMRAADGFDTLPETALIAHQVRVEEARGDFEAAWKFEQSMLAVARQHAGELGTLPVYRDMARKRREILERYRSGEIPPQIVLGCYYDREVMLRQLFVEPLYDPPDKCSSGDRTNAMAALLGDIRMNELLALEALYKNGMYASDEMQELLADILSLSEQIRLWLPRGVSVNESGFIDHLLTELVAYQPRNSAERVRRAEVLITIADTNVLRAQRSSTERARRAEVLITNADTNVLRAHRSRRSWDFDQVLDQYRQAYALLQREGVEQARLDELFSPAIPVMLPAYRGNPLRGGEGNTSRGYIDVSFEVTQRGVSRKIRVQEMSEGVERADRNQLSESIRRGKFRPSLVHGEFPAAVPVSLRYYLP